MTLKEQIAGDVADLFFMLEDFGEEHKVEGETILVVPDEDTLQSLKSTDIGLSEATLLIYARVKDLPGRKAPGSFINYDGREMMVINWTENYGVAALALKQNCTA
ncbi:MAG: sugar ABC transporter ATP-binding protein [Blautia sp.]|nr:sugar ABC transporter ATP-binding protein [Blautia sp.]